MAKGYGGKNYENKRAAKPAPAKAGMGTGEQGQQPGSPGKGRQGVAARPYMPPVLEDRLWEARRDRQRN